jgi:hypothetical protein
MTAKASDDVTTKNSSRRAILAGALGGVGAWALGAIGRAPAVRAADDEAMLVGGEYAASTVTSLTNNSNTNTVFRAESNTGVAIWGSGLQGVVGTSGPGAGVQGGSESSYGVYGHSDTNRGVFGISNSDTFAAIEGRASNGNTAVMAYSGSSAPIGGISATGVYGLADDGSTSRGVVGASPAGQGVRGETTSGVGLYGTADSGYAIRGSGRVRFDRVSGVARIPAGSTSVKVTPGLNVVSSSFALLTPKTNIGSYSLWFTTNTTANTLTIHMSHTRSTGTWVAWLLVG